jgi:hypothetical protein
VTKKFEISPNFSVLPICPKIQDTHFINNRETKGKTKTVTKAADHTKELTPKNFCYQKCRHAWNDGRGKTKTWGKRG